jgi:DNA-binding NtrC family response regulator
METVRRILIVDDEPQLLKMMSRYLERLGYTVTVSETTEEARRLVDAEPEGFAAAVLDSSMEGLTMEELALQILESNGSTRVLATSGYPVDVSGLKAAAPGRVVFLHKPFPPEALAATLRRMLGPEKEEI